MFHVDAHRQTENSNFATAERQRAKMSKNIKIYKVGKNIATNKKRTQ